jgi:cation diffusion facilitator family transporter
MQPSPSLKRFAWLSIAAAIATISLKAGAYGLTGSVGLLSDALESLVNLVAAIVALVAISVAEREPTEEHAYGFEKAEYFSSGLEGALILLAAVGIVVTAVPRVIEPQPLTAIGWGMGVSALASAINLVTAWLLLRAAREHRSITLEADAHHLLADVWTSAGVIAGVALVGITGWNRLDGLIALGVAVNIVRTGIGLVGRSMGGLLDAALPVDEQAKIQAVLARYRDSDAIEWHALRTRQAGRRRFISMHVLVPGDWSVQRGHELLEAIEHDLHETLSRATIFTHLEPLEDPTSWEDTSLDRRIPSGRSATYERSAPGVRRP